MPLSSDVNNGDKLTFKAANYKGSQIFLQRPMDEALGYAYVEITRAPTDPYVRIAGEPAIMGQETPIPGGSGTYLYVDAGYDGNILTHKDATINKTDSIKAVQAIRFGQNGYYTIKLEGENKISGFSSGIVAPNDSGVDDVTVVLSGSGSLDISANQYAIDMQVGKLKFENTGKIMLTTGYTYPASTLNALHVAGNVTIDKTKYDIVGVKQDIEGTRENISDNPNLDTILKGTSTEKDLYFKSITITPAAAKDSTISYDGTTLKQGETIKDGKGGTATVDSKNNTITLNNFKGTQALSFDATLADSTLVLEGTNTLSSIVTTQKGLTISGSGSLTVGSIKVHNQKTSSVDKPNLTINGATVTVGTAELTTRAIDIDGDLTVTNGSLTATSNSDNVPTVQVGGNATFTGSTVAITNHSDRQGEQYKDSNAASSALHVNGAVTISGGTVMAEAKAGGNAIRAVGNITVSNDATVTAKNNSQYFNAITAGRATGGEVNTLYNLIVSGENTRITATNTHDNNLTYGGAINAYIKNANEGHYLQVGTDTKAIAPNVNTTVRNNSLTITRGGAYSAPTTISKIIITGLTPPVKGATPVDKSKVTLTDGLTVESITWGPALTSDGKFAANTAYTAHINYSVKAGYELAAKANCPQVDGANVTRWHQEGMPQDEIEVTFPKTAADTPTEKPTITLDLPAPVAGVAPVTTGVTATSSDNTPLTIDKVEWYAYTVEYNKTDGNFDRIVKGNKVSGNFEANTYYLAEITFDKSISFANGGLNITAPTWPLEGSCPESCIYRVIENSYTARILFPATDAACNHVEGPWQSDGQGGQHIKKCTKCGTVMFSEEHSYKYTYESLTTHRVNCGVCGENFVRAHIYTDSYVPTPDGTQHHGKCICGAEETTLRDHVFVNGVCVCGVTQSGGDPTPDIPAAPTGLVGVAPTSANSKDGKITGTTAAMEYATEPNGSNWIECGGDEVTGLSAGTYYVRYKRTTDKPASAVATVVVPAYSGGGEIVPTTPDNPGTIVIIRPAEEENPAQQPNPSTGANDLVGLAVAAAVAAALGSAALLRKHD